MEQARSGIAAGLYRAGLLGRAISLGICAVMATGRLTCCVGLSLVTVRDPL